MSKKVELARSLALDPALALRDEPPIELDQESTQIGLRFDRSAGAGWRTLLLIEQNAPFELAVDDQAIVLDAAAGGDGGRDCSTTRKSRGSTSEPALTTPLAQRQRTP